MRKPICRLTHLRFLWFSDINSENPVIERYRFCRILFGATCSQFVLNATIRKHVSKYEKVDAEFARKLRNHFYVDDLNSGTYNVENGFALYEKVKINLLNASFIVRKWQTNSDSLRSLIYNCEKSFDSENFTTAENEKVLGVTWHKKNDVLIFGLLDIFNAAVNITPTKNILSVTASVYDPIGYKQPIVIKLKLLFQEVCLLNVSWDDVISEQLLQKWMVIIESLRECIDFEIKRCYYIYDFTDPVEFLFAWLFGFIVVRL